MNPVILAAVISSALKFALDAAAAILEGNKGANIDDAIAALRQAANTPLHATPPPTTPTPTVG